MIPGHRCQECGALVVTTRKALERGAGVTDRDEQDRYLVAWASVHFVPVRMPNGKLRTTPVSEDGADETWGSPAGLNALSILHCFADMQLHGGGSDVAAAYGFRQ